MIQQYAIKNSRLHIPLIFGVDAVHGFGHPWQAPLFPQSIGMGATWDPSAARAGGVATADAVRATGSFILIDEATNRTVAAGMLR